MIPSALRPATAGPILLALAAAACASGRADPPFPGLERSPPGAAADDRPVLDLAETAPADPPPSPEARGLLPAGEDPVVAEVDGVPVRAGEVARFLFRFDPGRALEGLNQILDSRILEADAAASGVTLPPGEIEARVEEEVRRQETDVRVQYGPGVSLDDYLKERFGFTRESFRKDLVEVVRVRALRDRVVRYQALSEERIRIRVLVLPDEEGARDAARRLREGADFAALARQVSLAPVDDLPPYRREDVQPAELAAELFAMEPGDVSRPVRVARDGRELFQVFKVVEKRAARRAPWPEVAAEIEKELRARPVSTAEYLQWARGARERHGVKIHLEEPAAAGGAR